MPRLKSYNMRVGVKQGVGAWSEKYVVLDFDNFEPITLDMEDAVRLHRRLGTFIGKHTTPNQRKQATRR